MRHYGTAWAARLATVGALLATAAGVVWLVGGPAWIGVALLALAMALAGAVLGASVSDIPPPLYRGPSLAAQVRAWEAAQDRDITSR